MILDAGEGGEPVPTACIQKKKGGSQERRSPSSGSKPAINIEKLYYKTILFYIYMVDF